ncbi:MAG: hypothetical protein WD002_02965 [Pseudomonadales bacterium]
MTRIVYEGNPIRLINPAAGKQGSIHDDDKAREMGFRRGFVPGTTISLLVEDAIGDYFGPAWFEGGWHDMKFVAAVYDDEPVRVVLTEDDGPGVGFAVLTEEDRSTCVGRLGLGTNPPWNAAEDGKRAGIAFPQSVLGTQLEPLDFTPAKALFEQALSPGVAGRWFTGKSPFGGALTPSCALLPITRHGQSQLPIENAVLPGMNGRMQMVFESPIFLDESYRAELRLVDKGESGRTWFRTIEYQLFNEGACYGFGRHTVKWWAPGIVV